MIEEHSRVLAVKEGQAYVSALRQSSCGHCSARSGCGTSVLSRYIGKRSMEMWVDDPIGVLVNDEVVIQMHEAGLVKASFLLYLMPLLLLIGFALLGEQISDNLNLDSEWLVILFALLGLTMAYGWLRRFEQQIIDDNRLRPVIIKRINTFSLVPIAAQGDL